MNTYSWIIVGALLLNSVVAVVAECLNLKALQTDLPREFSGVYDPAEYKRSQEYTRAQTRFGFVASFFDLAVLLIFWFLGCFNWVDQFARSLAAPPILSGLLFIALLMALKFIVSLPFSLYSTFVLEERFGFNKTTIQTFIIDILKGLCLSVVLGGILLALVLTLFEYGGPWAWLYCWLVVTIFTLLIQFVAPTWIMPLFNKFVPLEEGELREAILSYARSVGFSLENVFVMDGSKRSSKSNAFFTGFGKRKRIALFDTLIDKHSTDELVAVLAHEIGHYKKRHILKGMIIGICHMGIMLYLVSIILTNRGLFDAFYMDEISVAAGLVFFGLLLSPIELVLSTLMNSISRANEYEADAFAVQTFRRGNALIPALKKLAADNLSNVTPHPFYVFLNYSHPPLLERIKAIRGVDGGSDDS